MSALESYKILGVSPSATDDEVKKAYRNLARKYHPDIYEDGPLSDLAQEKMQQINAAYDEIVRYRKTGAGSYDSRNGAGYGRSSGYDTGAQSKFGDVRRLISIGRFYDAESILDGVPTTGRNGEWYYLKGIIFQKKGWFEEAFRHINTACHLEPDNQEYRATLEMLISRRNGGYGNSSGRDSGVCGSGGSYNNNDCGCCCDAISCCACMNLMDCC